LAARYLADRDLSLQQIRDLIAHPDDPEGKLIPQLHETAAWLAGMMPSVYRMMMQVEPEVLLRSDVMPEMPRPRNWSVFSELLHDGKKKLGLPTVLSLSIWTDNGVDYSNWHK
jgi:hypothetical protein